MGLKNQNTILNRDNKDAGDGNIMVNVKWLRVNGNQIGKMN